MYCYGELEGENLLKSLTVSGLYIDKLPSFSEHNFLLPKHVKINDFGSAEYVIPIAIQNPTKLEELTLGFQDSRLSLALLVASFSKLRVVRINMPLPLNRIQYFLQGYLERYRSFHKLDMLDFCVYWSPYSRNIYDIVKMQLTVIAKKVKIKLQNYEHQHIFVDRGILLTHYDLLTKKVIVNKRIAKLKLRDIQDQSSIIFTQVNEETFN